MTHTDTLRALHRAVVLAPGDDTARLVFADALDEAAGTVPCAKCEGTRIQRVIGGYGECSECRGTGTVSDGFAERAELIRVQCELERLHVAGHGTQPESGPACPVLLFARKNPRAGGQVMPRCHICEGAFDKEQRERDLLAAHGHKWHRVPCPACDGAGEADGGHVGMYGCPFCAPPGTPPTADVQGTGDARLQWRRGFPWCVHGVRFADVLEFVPPKWGRGAEWQPTAWARRVAESLPVIAWEVVDREPYTGGGVWRFDLREMPEAVAREMELLPVWYDTAELAREALALALGRVVRRACGLSTEQLR